MIKRIKNKVLRVRYTPGNIAKLERRMGIKIFASGKFSGRYSGTMQIELDYRGGRWDVELAVKPEKMWR